VTQALELWQLSKQPATCILHFWIRIWGKWKWPSDLKTIKTRSQEGGPPIFGLVDRWTYIYYAHVIAYQKLPFSGWGDRSDLVTWSYEKTSPCYPKWTTPRVSHRYASMGWNIITISSTSSWKRIYAHVLAYQTFFLVGGGGVTWCPCYPIEGRPLLTLLCVVDVILNWNNTTTSTCIPHVL
jgi:hypothetical protein